MTAPAGSIGIGVTLDAGDLTAKLTDEVTKAMSGVLKTLGVGIADIQQAMRQVDLDDMSSKIAADNEKMERASKKAADAIDKLGDEMDDTADQAKKGAKETEGAAKANDKLDETAKKAEKSTGKLGGAIGKATGFLAKYGSIAAGIAGLGGIGTVLTKGLDRLTAIDDARAKLDGLGHSAEGVDAIMESALAGVKGTAYGLGDAASAAASAVASGIKPGTELERTIKLMGDAASIAGTDLNSMADIFNKVAATGKVSGREMAQLASAGIPALQLLSDELGVTTEEVNKMVSAGQVGFEDFQNAIEKGMGGAALTAGQTFSGAVDNMGAALGRLGAEILDGPFKAAPAMIGNVTGFVDGLTDKVKGLRQVLVDGEFTETFREAFDVEEDDPFTERLFRIREGVIQTKGALDLLRTGNYTAEIGKALGVDEDSDLVDRLLTIREIASGWFDQLGNILSTLFDGAKRLADPLGRIAGTLATAAAATGVSFWSVLLSLLEALAPLLVNTLVPAVEMLATFLEQNQTAVTLLIGAFTAYHGVMKVATTLTAAQTGAKKLYEAATKKATGTTKGFNAVLKANAFGLIVTAIAAVVGGLTWFFTQTETGQRIFENFKDIVVGAWETITGAFSTAWDFISGVFEGIKDAISSVIGWITDNWQLIVPIIFGPLGMIVTFVITFWDQIKAVFTGAINVISGALSFLWNNVVKPVFDGIGAIISAAWNGVIKPLFQAWHTVITGVVIPILLFLWNNTVKRVFDGIVALIRKGWDGIKLVFDLIRGGIEFVGSIFTWLYENVVKPVWDWIGSVIKGAWENVIRPAWDALNTGLEKVGEFFNWLYDDVIKPVWDWIGDTISKVVDNVVLPAWEAMKTGLEKVGQFFDTVVKGIETVWNKLHNILAKPINFMIGTVYNSGIRQAWNAVQKFIPGLIEAPELSLIPERATGGPIYGPGTGTSDEVLMWGSNGEHVVTALEVLRAGGQNVLYAIRDMIYRGIPFTWEQGRIIPMLGGNSLRAYGAEVNRQGYGNVDPQGMFDDLLPRFAQGGAIEPWHEQLRRGHEFARAQHGKPYQWAGPRHIHDSFDCTGFMSSIAAVILGMNPWQRYFYTGSFGRGQGPGGPMGFRPGVDAGFSIGVTDDPGGPGGGHAAGVLGAVPGFTGAMRVESAGGGVGVQYGNGPDVMSFLGQYHLPIGANGFFQGGSGTTGPSPEEQRGWLARKAHDILSSVTSPIKNMFATHVGTPPPEWFAIPPKFLDTGVDAAADLVDKTVNGLGDRLSSAWAGAQRLLGSVIPFDSGGIAHGTGFMPKNIIAPERVLSPHQTELFELLVTTLDRLTGGAVQSAVRGDRLRDVTEAVQAQTTVIDESGAEVADAVEVADANAAARDGQTQDLLAELVDDWIEGAIAAPLREALTDVLGSEEAARLVNDLVSGLGAEVSDAFSAAGDALIRGVANTVTGAVENLLLGALDEAFGRTDPDAYGGWFTQAWAKTVGAQIEVPDLLRQLTDEIRKFRGDVSAGFNATGQLYSDTAWLTDRHETSAELSDEVQRAAMEELLRATVETLIRNILIPALTALLSGLIIAGLAAIGTAIGGPIGGAIGAAAGAGVSAVIGGILGNVMGTFDSGGIAHGTGWMPKATIEPERVLSPRQTALFERMVTALESGAEPGGRVVEVHAPFTVTGDARGARDAHDHLLSLLNN